MVNEEKESSKCTGARAYFWNEKLSRNQISESEGLCVIVIRRQYKRIHPCPCLTCYSSPSFRRSYGTSSSTVIPFDLSRLFKKDSSLFTMLLSATLQFTSKDIIQMSNTISYTLFTLFDDFSQLQSSSSPRPPYVIAVEITQHLIDDTSHCSLFIPPSPPIPSFCRFKKDWDEEEELLTSAHSVSIADYWSDPYHKYYDYVLEYLCALREYTGEGGICPTKPPIDADLAKGLQPLKLSEKPTVNDYIRDLMDDTCPVCYEDFKDKKEVITTNCMHEFHIHCLVKWLSKNNTCPTCRAVYPLHYSPVSNCCRKRPHHNILEEPNGKRQHMGA